MIIAINVGHGTSVGEHPGSCRDHMTRPASRAFDFQKGSWEGLSVVHQNVSWSCCWSRIVKQEVREQWTQ